MTPDGSRTVPGPDDVNGASPPRRGAENRAAWIGAGAAVVVALITTFGAIYTSTRGADDRSGGAGPPASGQAPEVSDVPDGGAAGAASWQGTLLVGAYGKDLDGVEGGDTDLYVSSDFGDGPQVGAANGAAVSVWQGADLPDYAGCAGTADAGSVSLQPLAQGAVLCVRTSGGHIARLRLTKPPGNSPDGSATFDAVIWSVG